MDSAALVEAARAGFAVAQERAGATQVNGSLAGRPLQLRFAGDYFAGQFLPALALGPDGESPPDLAVAAWDAASTGVRLDWPAWLGKQLGPVGVVEELTDDRYHVSLDIHAALVSVIDLHDGLAYHYVPEPALMPAWEHTHPARLLWSAWARSRGLLTCHAAAVGSEGRGVLLVGSSGSGKSTTALVCMADGMQSAGDDYVLVEIAGQPKVHPLYTSTLLAIDHARRYENLMPHVDHIARTGDRAKAVMFAGGADRPAISRGFPLVGIVALRVEPGSKPAYTAASPGAVLRALAPSTLGQLGMVDAAGLRGLADLCRRLPCFQLRLGDDPAPVPDLVRGLISDAERLAPAGALISG
jgi:hypothetical protein